MLPQHIFRPPLKNLTQFVEEMTTLGTQRIFRGQANSTWDLRPKAGREEFVREGQFVFGSNTYHADLRDFENWKRNAVAFCERLPEKKLECLAYAQHYGLATRLLDWTDNPLVALFFAVETEPQSEGIVFCYDPGLGFLGEDFDPFEPHDNPPVSSLYRPRPFDRRIQAQQGLFTYHFHPGAPFDFPQPADQEPFEDLTFEDSSWIMSRRELTAFPILQEHKQTMMNQLARVGVSRKTLFPDLEGLSKYINWEACRERSDLAVELLPVSSQGT